MNTKSKEVTRFHPSKQNYAEIMLATKPRGTILAKFHGEPVLLPAQEPGEKLFGKSRFTPRQLDTLMTYEARRRATLMQNNGIS